MPNKPRGPKLSDDERRQIVEAIQTGEGCKEIADRFGRSTDTVSRIASTIGWRFGELNRKRMHDARSAYAAERRARIAQRLTEESERLLDALSQPFTVYNFGGKDNTFNQHKFDTAPLPARAETVRTIGVAMRTVMEIDKHDNASDEGMAAVDQWLRSLLSGPTDDE